MCYLTLNKNKDNYIYDNSDEYYGDELIHWYDLGMKVEIIEEDLEETKKCLKEANEEIERLNNIINEAIEYIKKHGDYNKSSGCIEELDLYKINELLEILKGSEKE